MPTGVYEHKKGYKRPPSVCLKISLAKKGKPNGLLGKVRSEQTRINISKSMIKNGTISTQGYKVIYVNRKRVLEHRYVWEKVNGKIPKGFQIHHINNDRLDNRIENLTIMSLEEHGRLHGAEHGKVKNIINI